jgi:3-deoxy-7-phosphoheptulonate synthase
VPHPAETVVGASPAVVAGLDHWRTLPVVQQPVWPDPARAAEAAAEVASMPPLVFAGEIDQLRG